MLYITAFYGTHAHTTLPSLGIVKMGICVIDPFLPSTRPALYNQNNWHYTINNWYYTINNWYYIISLHVKYAHIDGHRQTDDTHLHKIT